MRVAALYDIHGNLPALDAVLDEVRRLGVDRIIVGGDVMPGPMPRACLDRLHALDVPVQYIHGNGDRVVLLHLRGGDISEVPEPFRDAIRWCASEIGPREEQSIAAWVSTIRLTVPGLGDVLFCHATPRNDTEIFTRLTDEERLAPAFEGVEASVVVCGHTHMQFDRTVRRIRVVNAGSVGMPFAEAGAYWLLLTPDPQLQHTRYDVDAAARAIGATGYPGAQAFAERHVLQPPSEAEMLAAFAGAELR